MKKNYILLIFALLFGILLGYLLFSDSENEHSQTQTSVSEQWTCSMHPQILQPEPGKCPICGMDLIPRGDGSIIATGSGQFKLSETAEALAGIQTIIVGTQKPGTLTLRISGIVQPDQKATGSQSAYFDGRIESLRVNYVGEYVKRGQLLATLYSPELISAQRELITAKAFESNQPELYSAVRKKLTLWKLTESQISAIEKSGSVLEYFPIYAQVSGTVTEIAVVAGDYIKQGHRLFQIADLNTVWGVFDVYENQLSRIKLNDPVRIKVSGNIQDELTAKVSYISPTLNTATRTAEVRVILPNSSGSLKPGMFISGELSNVTTDSEPELIVPETAVMWTGERSIVYVKPDPALPVFEMREVLLGRLTESGYPIRSGLKEGEWVVTHGTFTLDAAAQLQGANSMMQPGAETVSRIEAEDANLFENLLKTYLVIKDALVKDNSGNSQSNASEVLKKHQEELNGSSLASVVPILKVIANSTDIEIQRDAFRQLSEFMIRAGKSGVVPGQTYYIQHCPMANNSKGASWISIQEDIKNPYYGAAMLTCGSVQDIWSKN